MAGADVCMIGRVGDDAFADRLVANLVDQNVDHAGVTRTPDCTSGLAIVAVEDSGQNAILLVAGANGLVSTDDVHKQVAAIKSADVLLLQLEIPTQSVIAAIAAATT